MAAGDYVVRRNVSNTDTIPDAGSDLLLIWDTAVANVGSGITHSAGIFTLGETGHFLVMCSDTEDVTDNTNNERINTKMTLTLAGVELVEGYSTAYIRKNSHGTIACLFSAAIIEVTTTVGNGDEIQWRKERIDNTVVAGNESHRSANNRSGVTIIKLDDALSYARYRSSSVTATSVTDNVRTVMNLATQDEQEGPFTRTGNVVDIASNRLILAVYSVKCEDVTSATRQEFQANLELGGSSLPGSWTHQYIRDSDNCIWGGSSCVVLIESVSGNDIDLGVISREAGGLDYEGVLQLVELPAGAEACIVEATGGDYNVIATNFAWDTNPRPEADAFTHTVGQSNIDVDNAGDYLAICDLGDNPNLGAAVGRAIPFAQFRVNTTDLEIAGSSSYHRNTTTARHSSVATGALITGLIAGDSVHVRMDRASISGTGAIPITDGAFSLIRLSSLFGVAGEFPLDVDPASFVLTGILADIVGDFIIPNDAVPGSLVLTGIEVGPEEFGQIVLPGSYAFNGFVTAHEIDFPASFGVYTLTGIAAILEFLVFNQEGFRWRNDDGTEITATWRQLQDIKDSVDKGDIVRARFLIDAMGDQASTLFQVDYKESLDPDIEYRKVEVE